MPIKKGMKKSILYASLFIAVSLSLIAAESETALTDDAAVNTENTLSGYAPALITSPARRPNKGDSEKCAARKAEDKNEEDDEKRRDTLKYGITSEVAELLTALTKNDDPRYVDEVYDMFQKAQSTDVKDKALSYFASFADPCLSDFATKTLNEYYDNKTAIVNSCLHYAGEADCKDAIPAIVVIIKDGDEKFWQNALTAMGKIGGSSEAQFLTELFNDEKDEMSVIKKQSLVRALGMIHAVDTYDALTDMAENEDENTYVRMYAAEAIGKMGMAEGIPILAALYDASDPNLREYAIKGLANFSNSADAASIIIEGIKDAHPKVRIEAIKDAGKLALKDAMPLLLFRAKSDSEMQVKKAAYDVIAEFNTAEGAEFLCGILQDKKSSDSAKKQAALSLLKAGDSGDSAIKDAALAALADKTKKPLQQALASVIARYDKAAFAPVCKAYLESGDSTSVSLGLDMYNRGKYPSALDAVRRIADEKGSNKKRAMKILGIEEEKKE